MIRKGSFLKRRILCSVLRVLPSEKRIASADYAQDPPVPIPNTEVKLSGAENTCLETDREDRSMPTSKGLAQVKPFAFASLAQQVEHAAVNRRVVGSNPTGGANGV